MGNIVSDVEYDHMYGSSGSIFPVKDEWGNIVDVDDRGNQLYVDPKTGERTWVKRN